MAVVLAGLDAAPATLSAGALEAAQGERIADRQREGEAVLALADATMAGRRGAPSGEFTIRWRNAFLKAQQGTFVPFTLVIDARGALPESALVYVRAVARPAAQASSTLLQADRAQRPAAGRLASAGAARKPDSEYPVDAIFPVALRPDGTNGASVNRGFSIAPGHYDVYVVVRERLSGLERGATVRAGVTVQPLLVPDFRDGELTTSSVILADRLTVLPEPLTADQLVERPYVFGQNEITPAADQQFRRSEELVVVFLVYNPTVTPEKHFDVQVEYHFFQRSTGGKQAAAPGSHPPLLEGEQYFNHTIPQRFSPDMLGLQFDPDAGHPVLAGQGIPLAGFEPGDYRLAIKVIDRLSGKFVMRDVTFTVS
jgi:hypothetical protein